MTKFTIDTNILFYSVDNRDPQKHKIANQCVAELERRFGSIPLQCLAELYQALTRKRILPAWQAQVLVQRFASLLPTLPASKSDLEEAMESSTTGKMQFFDALLVSTAARAGCEVLLTEDMQHGQQTSRLEILNPFVMTADHLHKLLT